MYQCEEEVLAKSQLFTKDILVELHYLCDNVDKIVKAKKTAPKDLHLVTLYSLHIKRIVSANRPKDFTIP